MNLTGAAHNEWCCTGLFEHVWLKLLYLLGGRDQHVMCGCRKMAPDNNAPFMGGTRHDLQTLVADSNEDATVITDQMNELRFSCPPDAARAFPLQKVVKSTRCVCICHRLRRRIFQIDMTAR